MTTIKPKAPGVPDAPTVERAATVEQTSTAKAADASRAAAPSETFSRDGASTVEGTGAKPPAERVPLSSNAPVASFAAQWVDEAVAVAAERGIDPANCERFAERLSGAARELLAGKSDAGLDFVAIEQGLAELAQKLAPEVFSPAELHRIERSENYVVDRNMSSFDAFNLVARRVEEAKARMRGAASPAK
ncbi:MAG: hypothetical protein IT381_01385 [Deltaproteobacteria bacterium]|nr:hypothetical protein [Deltaproteobacteria bacterium]